MTRASKWLGLPTAILLLALTLAAGTPVPCNATRIFGDVPTPAGKEALPAPSASAKDLFSRYKDRLVQVRVLLNAANEQAALGSAFVVRSPGPDGKGAWLLTNYHVISALALDPSKYRLELRRTSDLTVPARLIALDVTHDLAVLEADALPDSTTGPKGNASNAWPVLPLREQPAVQGEQLFAMGNPLEIGFLISEGIYNGKVEQRIHEQMVFSGALNSGMSGGPAIDTSGRVVGVNVSTHRRGQQLSFLVPIRYARELLARAATADATADAVANATKDATKANNSAAGTDRWRREIGRQLLAHQENVAERLFQSAASPTVVGGKTDDNKQLAGLASQTLSGRTVTTLDGSLTKCWAGTRDNDQPRFHRESLKCTLNAQVFATARLQTGSVTLSHVLWRNEKLATAQFLALGSSPAYMRYARQLDGSLETTRTECRDEYAQGKKHVYRVQSCLGALKRFEGLYDMSISAIQVDNARERLSTSITINGFSFENAQRLGQQFLERLQ
jgi:serine protease Do